MAKKLSGKYYLKNKASGSYTDVTTLFDGVNILAVDNMTSLGKAINVYKEQWQDSDVEDFMITNDEGRIIRENVDITVTFIVSKKYASLSSVLTGHGAASCQTQVQTGVYLSQAVCFLPQGDTIKTDVSVSFYKYQNGSRVLLGTGTSYTAVADTTIYVALSNAGYVSWSTYTPNVNDFDTQTVCDAFLDYMTATDVWIASKYTDKQVHCVCMDGVEFKTIKLKRGDASYVMGEIKLHTLEKPEPYIA